MPLLYVNTWRLSYEPPMGSSGETDQPDCEVNEKVELIKAVAKAVGVDMSEIFDH